MAPFDLFYLRKNMTNLFCKTQVGNFMRNIKKMDLKYQNSDFLVLALFWTLIILEKVRAIQNCWHTITT